VGGQRQGFLHGEKGVENVVLKREGGW
jgi:hypothetical protein